MHAWRILSSPQRNEAFVRESGLETVQGATRRGENRSGVLEKVLAWLQMGQSITVIFVSVLRTHARTQGWSAGQRAGGDILDNGESAAPGFLAKKLPER